MTQWKVGPALPLPDLIELMKLLNINCLLNGRLRLCDTSLTSLLD